MYISTHGVPTCYVNLYHAARCVDLVYKYFCNCTNIWKGSRCNIRKNRCEIANECSNISLCIPLHNNTYRCNCRKGKY